MLLHRARAQSTLILAVLAVTLVATALLGTFALLLSTSATRAPQVALDRTRADATSIDVTAVVGVGGSPEAVVASTRQAVADLLGPVDAAVEAWWSSPWLVVQDQDDAPSPPLVYLADYPVVPEHATLVDGAWPTAPGGAGTRVVDVAVPQGAADAYGWSVDDELTASEAERGGTVTVRVVGVYRADPPRSTWRRDLLAGRGHDPALAFPGSLGITSDAWGPFVVARTTTDDAAQIVPGTFRVVARPDVEDTSPADLDALRDRLRTARTDVLAQIPANAALTTSLDRTLDTMRASLAVTRVGVLVVGLLLLVVAITVLLLAARLLAERRTAEQTLLTSRGASHVQLLSLAALEALGVAAGATLVAPWLAGLVYRAVTSVRVLRDAGLHVDPGLPASLWFTCVLASVLLAAVLLAPSLRRRVSAVDSEQQEVRQDRRQLLARSGVDLAVVVVAGVALWQLLQQGSPVLDGGFDPVPVAAPALVLLAGGVLAGRVLPLLAGVGEVVAARSRALVAPLTAWELSRRPRRAAAAVLLVTLAVATGTFAQGWLDTWRTSQREQAELELGTDLRVHDLDGTVLAQSTALGAVDRLPVVTPVGLRDVQTAIATGASTSSTGITATLLAVDANHAGDLLRGRVDGGWSVPARGLAPASPVHGAPVPAGTTQLVLSLRTGLEDDVARAQVTASVVLQDSRGARTTIDLPAVPLDPAPPGLEGVTPTDVTLDLPEGLGASQVVGVSLRARQTGMLDLATVDDHTFEFLTFESAMTMRALDAAGNATPVDLARGAWRTTLLDTSDFGPPSTRIGGTWVEDGALHVTGATTPLGLSSPGLELYSTAFDREPIVHALVTPELMDQLTADPDDVLVVSVGGVDVQLRIDEVVPYLPGLPRGAAVLVDRDALQRAMLVDGSREALVDEWWGHVTDADAAQVAAAVDRSGAGLATTRVAAAAEATGGPLRVGVPAALWLVTVAAIALALAGVALSATVAVRTRRLELARLQALGASPGSLVRAVVGEYALLTVVGTVAGVAVGAVLARVVGPLLTVSATGGSPVPGTVVQWPWPALATVVGAVAVGALLVVVLTTRALLRRASGALLRLGDEG